MSENKTKNKKSPRGKLKIIILSILLLLFVSAVAVVVYTVSFHEPDNQAGVDETKPFEWVTAPTDESSEPEENPAPEEYGKSFNFLLLGKDQTSENTDVIMVINFNVSSGGISILQLPRDTYIELEKTPYKLNSLYHYFALEANGNNEKDPDAYSLNKVASVLEKNLCINIHYYAMVNLAGFRNIVDILGGVEVDIPANMDYEDDDQGLKIHLKKGKQVLDGKKAEQFVRFRSGYVQADIGRMDAQKIFMSALIKTVKENFTVSNIVKIANEVYKNVTTDVPLDDMVFFGKSLLSIDMNNINFMSMPGAAARSNGDTGLWYYIMNRKAMIPIIQQYFNIYNDVVINDAIFDANRVFTSTKIYPHIDKLYNSEPTEEQGGSQSAEDINGGSIHIPRV